MADRVDDHQRRFPAARLVLAPDPAVLEIPGRQFGLQPLHDLVGGVHLVRGILAPLGHDNLLSGAERRGGRHGQMRAKTPSRATKACCKAARTCPAISAVKSHPVTTCTRPS